MKEKDFDFGKVGKRMPYRLDPEEMNRMTDSILDACFKEEPVSVVQAKRPRTGIRYLYGGLSAAAMVVVIFLIAFFRNAGDTNDNLQTAMRDTVTVRKEWVADVKKAPEDTVRDIHAAKNANKGVNKAVVSPVADKSPVDSVIEDMDDDELAYLAEITGETIRGEWYN